MTRRSWLLLTIPLLLTGCGRGRAARRLVRRAGEPDIVNVKEDDADMQAAIQKARSTTGDFIKALQKPARGQADFAVKKMFKDGKKVEHMWITNVTWDGTYFHGVLNNEPNALKNVRLGDRASVARSEISDWMFVEHGRLKGGYSIRLLYDRALPADRRRMEEQAGMKFN